MTYMVVRVDRRSLERADVQAFSDRDDAARKAYELDSLAARGRGISPFQHKVEERED